MNRNTATRDKHRKLIAKDQPPCYRCGREINYQAHHLDPNSFTIDHITPLSRGGTDTLDNLAACCRKCNRDKSNRLEYGNGVTFVTERNW